MSDMIKVIIKKPHEKNGHMAYIENTLEALQKAVGGHIETVTIASDAVLIVNDEGAINDMQFNCRVCNLQLFGPAIVAGVDGDEFTDVPLTMTDWMKWIKA